MHCAGRRPLLSWAGHRSVPPCLDWYLTHAQICSRVPTPPRRRPPCLPRRHPTSASQGRRAHCAAAIPRAREKKRGNVRARKGERTRASMVALPHPCPPPARHARGRSCRRRGTRAAAAGAARHARGRRRRGTTRTLRYLHATPPFFLRLTPCRPDC